jgi:hypothetical protein
LFQDSKRQENVDVNEIDSEASLDENSIKDNSDDEGYEHGPDETPEERLEMQNNFIRKQLHANIVKETLEQIEQMGLNSAETVKEKSIEVF